MRGHRSRAMGVLATMVATVALASGLLVPADASAATHVDVVTHPSALVNPINGTGAGAVNPGAIGEFPGADLPFGMLQWSPDTQPNTAASGGGYSYDDSQISGYSLTHLSGTGCASYGDVPILPTLGAIGANPASTTAAFSHADEHASPGNYQLAAGSPAVNTSMAVTTRTGISKMTFPASTQANVLFKVASSANPASASSYHLIGRRAISGSVTSGGFCSTGTDYTLYFSAVFSRPFTSAGGWQGSAAPTPATSCHGAACGAFVTFDTTKNPVVLMKVGISFVSAANAAANIRAEDPGWSFQHIQDAATKSWDAMLGRIAVGGGTTANEETFYGALYHSLLSPSVVSDANGEYRGDDGRVHRSATRDEYANFSEWDIYRSQIELVSMLAPHQAGDMVQSLVNDAEQGGWLPKWAIADGDAIQMNGDSADPIIAAAYAFGVRNFDAKAALAAMVKGATKTETGHGLQIERQYLDQYIAQHYVDANSLDLSSIDYSIGGSVTLEYALDDFAIAQLAQATGAPAIATKMMARAHNWQYLFNPTTGYIQARNSDGSFPPGPAFSTSLLEPGGELGFEEGNAVQYTWSVPQDLAALSALMGGDAVASGKLDTFFTQLNATRNAPYDWAGNEPDLWTPWEYDYFAAPSKTQKVVRQIMTTLYSNAPVNEPGNDDLGAISSWYVWAALGLYPVTPGTANLALAAPLFPHVVITLGSGHQIVMHAPGATAGTPYIHSLVVSGAKVAPATPTCTTGSATPATTAWKQPWLPASIIATGADLTYSLSAQPDPTWSASPAESPPSFPKGRLPAVGSIQPSGAITVQAGQHTDVQLGLAPSQAGTTTVQWHASGTGLSATPSSGAFSLSNAPSRGGLPSCTLHAPADQTLSIGAVAPGAYVLNVTMKTSSGTSLPPVVLDVTVTS